jgi:hypothetical protein
MPTVTVPGSVTPDQAMATLRAELGPGCKVEPSNQGETIHVHRNLFARSKVRVRQTDGSTSFDVGTAAIGPVGYVISALWFTPRVAKVLEEAPQPRG